MFHLHHRLPGSSHPVQSASKQLDRQYFAQPARHFNLGGYLSVCSIFAGIWLPGSLALRLASTGWNTNCYFGTHLHTYIPVPGAATFSCPSNPAPRLEYLSSLRTTHDIFHPSDTTTVQFQLQLHCASAINSWSHYSGLRPISSRSRCQLTLI